jgi:pSer/pThr/pTyr-binding forkhead associated (FHA) protein
MSRWIPEPIASRIASRVRRRWGGSGGRSQDRPAAPPGESLELLVVEGPDAGHRFTLDGESVRVGRLVHQAGRSHRVGVRDPTVSPHQAEIHLGGEVAIEHRRGATNPTLLNGEPIERAVLCAGDRVQMGNTVLEVCARRGMTLSGLIAASGPMPVAAPARAPATTEVRAVLPQRALLRVLRGVGALEGRVFPVSADRVRVGRHEDNDVVLDEPGVSRFHAELVWEGDVLALIHASRTNPTRVDGPTVGNRTVLRDGQVIELADRVALAVSMPSDAGPSLWERMEEKLERDAEIQSRYGFRGSFLDLDVVDSHGLKVAAQSPEHIIVSFERFRAFAAEVVEEHDGQVLNSNGDELMCFFDDALAAVRAATALLERLPAWNATRNRLDAPFRVRQGIHSGESLLDRVRRVAYSPVLDVAGHLQKYAPVDGVLVSADTRAELPETVPGLALVPFGEVGREKVVAYRLEAQGPQR